MKFILAFLAIILSSLTFAHFYPNGQHNWGNNRDGGSVYHVVPGPIVGAGLPVLAIGLGAYWLVRQRRKNRTELHAIKSMATFGLVANFTGSQFAAEISTTR